MSKLPAHPSLTYGLAELATRVNNNHTQRTELLWLFNVIYQKEWFRIYSGKLEGTTIFVSVLLLLGHSTLPYLPFSSSFPRPAISWSYLRFFLVSCIFFLSTVASLRPRLWFSGKHLRQENAVNPSAVNHPFQG